MFSSNIQCSIHKDQNIIGICLYNQCDVQPSFCIDCQIDNHKHHQDYCLKFPQIEQKIQFYNQVLNIQQPFNIFKKEIINTLNLIGSQIYQSSFPFGEKMSSTKEEVNRLGYEIRIISDKIRRQTHIIEFLNEFQAEFRLKSQVFIDSLNNEKTIEKQVPRLRGRNSVILDSESRLIDKSRISRTKSDYILDSNILPVLQCKEFDSVQFQVDQVQRSGDIQIINDFCVQSDKCGIILLKPPLNEIRNNYIKLSFQIVSCQNRISLGVTTDIKKCSFANLESCGKVYSSWNFAEHNRQMRLKFGTTDTITCYVNKFQKTLEFSKNDKNIEIKLTQINFQNMKFYIFINKGQVALINNKEISKI